MLRNNKRTNPPPTSGGRQQDTTSRYPEHPERPSVGSDGIVDARTLARHLGVRTETVHRLAREGLIPSLQAGFHRRFNVDEVQAAIVLHAFPDEAHE